MKNVRLFTVVIVATIGLALPLPAQSSPAAASAATDVVASNQVNTAIEPAPRSEQRGRDRTKVVLQRAREHPGNCDIEFIGDSITQGWERGGSNVWKQYYGHRNCLNFGVDGDRTQHVLWRFEHGQLDGIKAKVAVVMIGTNNSNKEDYTEADILEGVTAIVRQIRARQPETKIILLGIFPRGRTFSSQRGKILQVNQALARLEDGKNIFYIDIGSELIENDGTISKSMMPDFLHPKQAGYKIWAQALEPKLKDLL